MPKKFKKVKILEQRLFESFQAKRGMLLRPEDVVSLMFDDAIATRVSNAAAIWAGVTPPGCNCVSRFHKTWQDFGESLRSEVAD